MHILLGHRHWRVHSRDLGGEITTPVGSVVQVVRVLTWFGVHYDRIGTTHRLPLGKGRIVVDGLIVRCLEVGDSFQTSQYAVRQRCIGAEEQALISLVLTAKIRLDQLQYQESLARRRFFRPRQVPSAEQPQHPHQADRQLLHGLQCVFASWRTTQLQCDATLLLSRERAVDHQAGDRAACRRPENHHLVILRKQLV